MSIDGQYLSGKRTPAWLTPKNNNTGRNNTSVDTGTKDNDNQNSTTIELERYNNEDAVQAFIDSQMKSGGSNLFRRFVNLITGKHPHKDDHSNQTNPDEVPTQPKGDTSNPTQEPPVMQISPTSSYDNGSNVTYGSDGTKYEKTNVTGSDGNTYTKVVVYDSDGTTVRGTYYTDKEGVIVEGSVTNKSGDLEFEIHSNEVTFGDQNNGNNTNPTGTTSSPQFTGNYGEIPEGYTKSVDNSTGIETYTSPDGNTRIEVRNVNGNKFTTTYENGQISTRCQTDKDGTNHFYEYSNGKISSITHAYKDGTSYVYEWNEEKGEFESTSMIKTDKDGNVSVYDWNEKTGKYEFVKTYKPDEEFNGNNDNNGQLNSDIEATLNQLGLSQTEKIALEINGSITIGNNKITLENGNLKIETIDNNSQSSEDIDKILDQLGLSETEKMGLAMTGGLTIGNMKITLENGNLKIETIGNNNNNQGDSNTIKLTNNDLMALLQQSNGEVTIGGEKYKVNKDGTLSPEGKPYEKYDVDMQGMTLTKRADNDNGISKEPPEPTKHEDSFTLEGQALQDLLSGKTVTVDGVTYRPNGSGTFSVTGKSGEFYYDKTTNSFKSSDSYDAEINLDPTKFSGYMEQLELQGFFTTEDGITFIGQKNDNGNWTFTINGQPNDGTKYVLYDDDKGNQSLGKIDNNSYGGYKTSDGSYIFFDKDGNPAYKETSVGKMNDVEVFIRTYVNENGESTGKKEYVDENGTRYNSPNVTLSDWEKDRLNDKHGGYVTLDDGTTVQNMGDGSYMVNGERCKLAPDGKTFISTENYTVSFTANNGNVTEQTYEGGKLAETATKDKYGNITQKVTMRPDGKGVAHVQNYTYDSKGNVTLTNQIEFNEKSQPAVQTVTDQWGGTSTTEYTYDSNGKRTGYTQTNVDAEGNKGYITYDENGNEVGAEFDVKNNQGQYVHINPNDFRNSSGQIDQQKVIDFARNNGLSTTYTGSAASDFFSDMKEAIANGKFKEWYDDYKKKKSSSNNGSSGSSSERSNNNSNSNNTGARYDQYGYAGSTGYVTNWGQGNVWQGNVTNYQGGSGYQNFDSYGHGQWVSHNDWTWAPGQSGNLGIVGGNGGGGGRTGGGGGGGAVRY